MPRIFFALSLPESVRQQLITLQARLGVAANAVKWVGKENLHLTLQFIGEVTELKLRQILQGAEMAAACCAKFSMMLADVGVFPSPAQPRVIWAGVSEGKEELTKLAQALDIALGRLPEKSFAPHVTLGRFRSGQISNIANALQTEELFRTEVITVESFYCFESTLTRRGPIYRQLKEIILS